MEDSIYSDEWGLTKLTAWVILVILVTNVEKTFFLN